MPSRRYTAPFQPHQGFLDRACDYELVVFVTFPEHHASILEKLAALGCGGQRFAVVVHNPGGLDSLSAPTHSAHESWACLAKSAGGDA